MKLPTSKSLNPLCGTIYSLLAGITLACGPAPKRDALPSSPLAQDRAAVSSQIPPTTKTPQESLRAGLEYLRKQQQSDGGWGQGGGWRQGANQKGGRVEGANLEDPSDLGNTCVSLVALLRAKSSTPDSEPSQSVQKAFEFICRQVEQADDQSLYVTAVRDTQMQVKIGTYVDTFLSGWALSELKGQLTEPSDEKRRVAALDKVVAKIERNQKDDGSFNENKGWAAVLSQGLCSKALNSAARSGAKVSNQALDKDQKQNLAGLDVAKADFSAPSAAAEPSSAGISLYREAAKLGGLWERSKSNIARRAEVQKRVDDPGSPALEKAKAVEELKQLANDDQAAAAAQKAVAGKLADSRYVAGFGNNGGEEFLSYLNLGESLHESGGEAWTAWKEKMQATLCSAQNADGSWAGNHCITGRTFCTSSALLTLLIDPSISTQTLSQSSTPEEPQTAAALRLQ